VNAYRITFLRVTRSEWGKLTALRSTWVVLSVIALITVGLAAAINWNVYRVPGAEVSPGALNAQAFLGVFGILMITGEFGSGLVRATFAAVPRRVPVLWAKAVALSAAALPLMLMVCATCLAAGEAFLPPGRRIPLGDIDGGALLGAAVAPVALALIGLGLGALVRHTAAAIAVYVLVMLVLPAILQPALPERVADDVLRFVPVAAAQAMYAGDSTNPFEMLAPGPAGLTIAAWVLLTLAAGSVALWRRDP